MNDKTTDKQNLPEPMLSVEGLHAYYGSSHVLHGVNLRVEAGQVVTLLGRNGMGKTTTLRGILGLTPPRSGKVRFMGRDITHLPPYRIARMGMGYVPEGRMVFPSLQVEENLLVAARLPANNPLAAKSQAEKAGATAPEPWTLDRVYKLFPRLGERRRNWGNQLSGGEAQMLAIGRALMTQPRLLMMDEATEGLSPLLRKEIWEVIETLKACGLAILLVDKNLHALLHLAQRHIILNKGRVVFSGESLALQKDPQLMHEHLGV